MTKKYSLEEFYNVDSDDIYRYTYIYMEVRWMVARITCPRISQSPLLILMEREMILLHTYKQHT